MGWIKKLRIRLMEKIRKTNALHYYQSYKENQWKDQKELLKEQDEKVSNLVKHAYAEVPFYKEYMEKHNLPPAYFQSVKDLEKLPIVGKEELKRQKNKVLANNIEDYSPEEKRTGGSTGEPFKYYLPKLSHSLMWANIWRGWNVTGYQPGDKIGVLAGGSLLSGFDVKRRLYYYLNNWIPFSSYNMSEETMDYYVSAMKKKKVKLLYSYSSSAYELANYILKKGYEIQLDGVITTSEVLLPHYREAIEKAFGCEVYDQYGANDGGVTAFECDQHEGLHIGMERCVVEIVDDDGNPVPDGEEGRILLTDLSNYAMPFIRYEVGDYGAITREPCACGRGLIRLTHIKGRQQEFIYSRNKRKVHGGFFSTTFRQYDAVEQFQVKQDQSGEIVIRLRLNDPSFEKQLDRLKQTIAKQAELDKVTIELTDQFEKTKGGKHKFVINNVAETNESVVR
ncbi:phenylacetate--CoA ligase family protein [Halobacillus mangrovi]|uniref:phenylacetate--CoA ligase family protein n=1 Tax=Halobacillus mangrovi TaxID=402384 RepID=UPI003D9587CB